MMLSIMTSLSLLLLTAAVLVREIRLALNE